jgi:hypothetical protein
LREHALTTLAVAGDVGAHSVEDWRDAFSADHITAFASAVANATANAEEGFCNVDVEACAVAGSESGCCKAELTAQPEELQQEDGYAAVCAPQLLLPLVLCSCWS